MEQLTSTKQSLRRIKLKIFGNSDSGKTTLIDSLKCSFLNSFFRRNRLTNTKRQNRKKEVLFFRKLKFILF
jgi:guanylate kinase